MIFFKIFSKIFFQNLLTTARKSATAWGCACACYARLFRRVCVGLPAVRVRPSACRRFWRFGVGVRLAVGCPCVGVFGVVVWVCGRVFFLYGLRNNRKRATAHGLRVSVCLRLRLPSVSVSAVFVRPSNIIFLSLIISPYSRGYFTRKRQPKNGEQCVSAHHHSHKHFSEHRHLSPRWIVSETFPMVGENLETGISAFFLVPYSQFVNSPAQ